MSEAKNPKNIYDVCEHRRGKRAADKMREEDAIKTLKAKPWERIAPEQEKYIVSPGLHKQEVVDSDGKIKYTVDEITVAISIYGKNSAIHKAMQNGEMVSQMILQKIKERNDKFILADVEKKLLARCIKKEKEIIV